MTEETNKPLLSISLLSCGTEPHIEDCLKGLVPLKKELGAEIIVVDTSPNKNGEVRCIIEKYADKVVDFDWCDDFAKARNAGLFECTGDWFMYVDDDEVLENEKYLISFFTSGEYKNFHVASIIIHDLLDESGGRSFDAWTPRLFEMKKGARFESRVHEHFVPAEYPLKALNTSVRHYGYIFESHEAFIAHVSRNIRLLQLELDEHPDNIPARIHLLQENVRKRDIDMQRRIAAECLAQLKRKSDRQSRIYQGLCKGILLRADRIEKDYTNIGIKDNLLLWKDDNVLPVVRAFFALEGARIYDAAALEASIGDDDTVKEYLDRSFDAAESYLYIYEKIRFEMDLHSDELSFYLSSIFDEENIKDMQGLLDWKGTVDAFLNSATASEIAKRYKEIHESSPFVIYSDVWQSGLRYAYFKASVDMGMLVSWMKEHGETPPEKLPDTENAYRLFTERLTGFCRETLRFFEIYKKSISDSVGGNKAADDLQKRQELATYLLPLFVQEEADDQYLDSGEEIPDSLAELKCIRDALKIYPAMDTVLVYYSHLYGLHTEQIYERQERKRSVKAEKARLEEMRGIIDILQKKVDSLVAAGNLNEAQILLDEIQKYVVTIPTMVK